MSNLNGDTNANKAAACTITINRSSVIISERCVVRGAMQSVSGCGGNGP